MQQIRLLFWLKWKLLLRVFRRSCSSWIGALLILFILTPVSFGIASFWGLVFVTSGPPEDANWLRAAMLGIYLFWIIIPIFGVTLNDSYDITRLFIYPISIRRLFVSVIVGALIDGATLLLLPTFAAVLIGFVRDPICAVVAVIGLILFLLHTLAMSQAILMVGAGLFRSRKFRDAAVLAFPLIYLVYYMRVFVARQAHWEQIPQFVHSPLWEWINYLPPGWCARAIYAAHSGAVLPAVLYLGGLFAFTAATFYFAGWALQQVYAGEAVIAPGKSRPATNAVLPPAALTVTHPSKSVSGDGPAARPGAMSPALLLLSSLIPSFVPQVVRAVAEKEIRYLLRDPYYKLVMVNLLWPIILPIVMIANGSAAAQWAVWIGPGFAVLSQMQLTFNVFGTEGGAISLLFLFPAERRRILLGKNLFHFGLFSCLSLIMTVEVFALSQDLMRSLLSLYWMELALLLNLAIGNLFSLYFPIRVVMRGWRVQARNSGQGFLFTMAYLALYIGSLLIFVPVAAAIAAPALNLFGISTGWLALSIPAGAAYVGGIYAWALYLAGLVFPEREEPIILKVSQEPQ